MCISQHLSEATQWALDSLEPIVSAADENWSSPQTLFLCFSLLFLMAKPVALSIGCCTELRAKSFYSCSFLMHVVQIAKQQYHLLSLKFFGWYKLSDTFTKTWSGGLSFVFVVFSQPAFVLDSSKSFSFPSCSLIQICFFDYTRLCVTSAWFYPRSKCSLLEENRRSK